MFCFFRLWWKRSWCVNKVYRDMIWEERNLLKQCGNGRMSKFFFLSLLANKSWLWKFVAPDRFFSIKLRNYKHFVLILTGELCTIQSQWWANLKTPNLTIVAVCIIVASFFTYDWLFLWLSLTFHRYCWCSLFSKFHNKISLYNQRLYKFKVQM